MPCCLLTYLLTYLLACSVSQNADAVLTSSASDKCKCRVIFLFNCLIENSSTKNLMTESSDIYLYGINL